MKTETSPQELRERFTTRGFVVVPALLSSTGTRELARWCDELQADRDTPDRALAYFEPSEAGPLLSRIENFEPFHCGLRALLQGTLLDLASLLLGEPAVLFKDKINFKLPGGGGFEPHQDIQAGWERYAREFVTAAVAIDAATPRNGCLELARWSHRHERIGALWEPLSERELHGVHFEPLPMAAGDAVLFDGFLPHRSAPNRTARPRRVLYVTYNPGSDGDQRARYFRDKRESYPPDRERVPGRTYEYKV
jgi:2-aminoethylphosphonate dioxygenase